VHKRSGIDYGFTQSKADIVQTKLEPSALTEKMSAAIAENLPKPDRIDHGCRTVWSTKSEQSRTMI